jgi:DNA-binding transcriptional LysR family regulator
MQLDLTDLRLFVRVAEEGTLSRASAKQHLSLAAASARIRALEEHAGLPLLYREARGVQLTPAGQSFLHHARAMLLQVEQLRRDLNEFEAGLRGQLRIFANTTATTDILPEVLPEFLNLHARINVDLQEKPNADIAKGVLEGRADLGVVSGDVDTRGLAAIHFSTDRLVLLVPAGHALAAHDEVAFAQTLGEDHVGMHEGSTILAHLQTVTERLGRSLRLRIQVSSFDTLCRMIAESAARRNLPLYALKQVELSDDWRTRERYVLVREGEALPAYAQDLIGLLKARQNGLTAG